MAMTDLILTVAGVSAVIHILTVAGMRSNVKQSANIFKRNVRQIRHWLEEESAFAAAKEMDKENPMSCHGKMLPKKRSTRRGK